MADEIKDLKGQVIDAAGKVADEVPADPQTKDKYFKSEKYGYLPAVVAAGFGVGAIFGHFMSKGALKGGLVGVGIASIGLIVIAGINQDKKK
jgi:hypothetical protein